LAPFAPGQWNLPQPSQFYMGDIGGGYQTGHMQQPMPFGSPDVIPTVPLTGPGSNQGGMQVYSFYSNQPFYSDAPGVYSFGPGFDGSEQYTPFHRMTNTQQVGYNSAAGYYPNPTQMTQVAQQGISQQQQAQTLEPAGQQTTLQNTGQASDPLSEILPTVITEKRRLGDEETQYNQPNQQMISQQVHQTAQQTDPQMSQQPLQPVSQQPGVEYQPQQQYAEEQFPSLITLKGHNYLVVPQRYFNPYGGTYHYGYQQPYAVYTPYSSYTPYSPYGPYSSYAYTHTVPVVVNPYGVTTQQRYQLVPVTYSQNTGYPNLYSGLTTVKVLVKTDDTNGYQRTPYQTPAYGRHSHYDEYGGYPRYRDYQHFGGYPHRRHRHSGYPYDHTLTSGYQVGYGLYQPHIS